MKGTTLDIAAENRARLKKLFSVSDGALLLCLDFAFHGNDQLKANAAQTFNSHNMQK